MPIHVGGHTKAAARRAGRLGDGFFPGKGSREEQAELFDVVRATAKEHGRDPDAIELTQRRQRRHRRRARSTRSRRSPTWA